LKASDSKISMVPFTVAVSSVISMYLYIDSLMFILIYQEEKINKFIDIFFLNGD
jgi:hypothetical protein